MPYLRKSRKIEDIRSPGRSQGKSKDLGLINLSYSPYARIPLAKIASWLVTGFAFVYLMTGAVSAPTTQIFAAPPPEEERLQLEAQLRDLEQQINQYEGQVDSYKKQGNTLKSQINLLNNKINKLNLQIRAINLTLVQLDRKIEDTSSQIGITKGEIADNQDAIGNLIKDIYKNEQTSLLTIFLRNPQLSDFFNDVNSANLLQGSLQVSLGRLMALHERLSDQKNQLSSARSDAATAKLYQASQKQEVEGTKQEKDNLLTKTKGEETRYQALLSQTKQTAAQIRSRLFQLLGGGELSFDQAYKFAKLAGDSTGINPALILAVLDRESALGQNVGRCKYNEIMQSGRTAMHPTRDTPVFLEITAHLGINPESVTVSCPNSDGSYGGALGPAQFIPSTWKVYADRVSAVTGRSPASPWNNADAFVATALYLKDSSGSCDSLYESQASIDRCAAAKYYAGSRWRTYLWTYGEAVVSRAQRFQSDIDTITG